MKEAGGELNVFSKPGEGSIFEILLPSVEDAVFVQPAPEISPVPARSSPATILLVEDEPCCGR